MARVLILWSRPTHLSVAEADAWTRSEVRRITGLPAVGTAELTQLRGACERLGCPHDWMLELDLADVATIEKGPCAEWLGDLRLLGMHPTVVVRGDTVSLTGEA